MKAPEDLESRLLYRDALMLVIDKPAGLPVHPGPKGGETLFQHLDALRFGLPRRPEAAHRLDKDTSGCLILGRHPKALARLNGLFRENAVDKVYWAVVEGGPDGDEGEIDLPLAPKSPERGWWMKVDEKGLPSLTRWRVLGRSVSGLSSAVLDSPDLNEGRDRLSSPTDLGCCRDQSLLAQVGNTRLVRGGAGGGGVSAKINQRVAPTPPPLTPPHKGEGKSGGLALLELRPVTGRTHQLRVHCAASGFPILGDPIYGTAPRFGGPGLHLHARAVSVPLYPKKPPIVVEAPVPEHMRERVEGLLGREV